jgi:hypothetical protein
MTPTLFDVPNIHNAETCSRNKVQAAILAEFERTGGDVCYTADDLQQLLGDFHGIHLALNSVGSRLNELRKKGLIGSPATSPRPAPRLRVTCSSVCWSCPSLRSVSEPSPADLCGLWLRSRA